ncbi:MAG: hypothetical protein ABI301_04165 [Jatrophihabitantaceae bacterium]
MTYAYPAGQYPTAGEPVRPKHLRGRKPLWAALIAFVIAVILFVVGGVILGTKALGKVDGFQRVSIASGEGTVTLDGTGKWVGYYEASDVSSSIDAIPHFRVAVTSPSNQNVTLESYGNLSDGKVKKLTYDSGGHKGAAAFQFTVTEKGTYRIQLQAVDSLPSGADVAIGRDIVAGTVVGALLILAGVLFVIAAIVLLIIGLVKRSGHKKQLASGAYGGAYGGAGPVQQWPPQPQQPQQWPAGQQQQPQQWPSAPQQWPNEPPQQQPQQPPQQWPNEPPQQPGQWPQQPPPEGSPTS